MGKILRVRWSETESAGYYINNDTCGKNKDGSFYLNSYSGKYTFREGQPVTLYDGVKTKEVNCISWFIEKIPSDEC